VPSVVACAAAQNAGASPQTVVGTLFCGQIVNIGVEENFSSVFFERWLERNVHAWDFCSFVKLIPDSTVYIFDC
jgi:hypothetical protein